MKITVETIVNAPLQQVWDAHNNPADIRQWNAASDDWHTTESTVDLREGGTFRSRMEARTAAPASISPARIPGSFPRRQLRTAWMTVAK